MILRSPLEKVTFFKNSWRTNNPITKNKNLTICNKIKRRINCVIKWCKILDSLVIRTIAIITWLATTIISIKTTTIVIIQSTIIIVSITSFTITTTCNFITTSDDNYGNITIGNLVNENNNGTILIQNL